MALDLGSITRRGLNPKEYARPDNQNPGRRRLAAKFTKLSSGSLAQVALILIVFV